MVVVQGMLEYLTNSFLSFCCGMSNPVARRDNNVKLQQMFISVRMDITDDQGKQRVRDYPFIAG
jgi:hypothetical protein